MANVFWIRGETRSAMPAPDPRQIIAGHWTPGEGGYWDRISAIRGYFAEQGGIGANEPGLTKAALDARICAVEDIFVQLARQSANEFAPYVMVDIGTGKPISQDRMHYEIQRGMDGPGNLSVEAFRGSGKTTQWVAKVIHLLGERPDEGMFKVISESGPTAALRVNYLRNLCEFNRRVRNVWPALGPQPGMAWGTESFTVRRSIQELNPSVEGFGIDSNRVGGRTKHLIGDDVTPPESVFSSTVREKTKVRWNGRISPTLIENGRTWFSFTPWHASDLGSQIRANPTFRHLRFGVGGPSGCVACPDNHGQPCGIPFHNPWSPRAWPSAALREIYGRDGSLSYSRSHQLVAISSETTLFPEWLYVGPHMRQDLVLGEPYRVWRERGVTTVMGVDLSLGAGATHDWVVIFVLGFDERGNRYIIDIDRFQSDDYRVQISRMTQAAAKYRPEIIFIEGTQFQRIVTDQIKFNTALPVKAFYPLGKGEGRKVEGADKKDLRFGVPSLRIEMENRKWQFPQGDAISRELIGLLIEEFRCFTVTEEGKLEGVGAHDDMVMAAWIANAAAKKFGASSWVDEQPALAEGAEELGPRIQGLEDLFRGQQAYPSTPADLGLLVARDAGTAIMVQVPEGPALPPGVKPAQGTRPAVGTYRTIYDATKGLESREAERLPFVIADMGRMPTTGELMRMGFSPRFSGTVVGLVNQWGKEAVLYVLSDRVAEEKHHTALQNPADDELDMDDLLDLGVGGDGAWAWSGTMQDDLD